MVLSERPRVAAKGGVAQRVLDRSAFAFQYTRILFKMKSASSTA